MSDDANPPEPLTDDELDDLDADIISDRRLIRALQDALDGKVRRYRAEINRRRAAEGPDATVVQLPKRERPEGSEDASDD
jgi:hypothetical protein